MMRGGVSRRDLLTAGGATVAVAPFARFTTAQAAEATPTGAAAGAPGKPIDMEITVNGQHQKLALDPRVTLLDALRERIGLTGTKKGCDHGQCGACTVLVGDRRVLSCLTLAASLRDPVVTIEGIKSPDGDLHPMQQAFIDHDAFQCGYCTPGQIMSAIACVKEGHADSSSEIREFMSGNLCRCAAYPHIVAAIQQAKPQMEKA
jgi:xanthine dehydrogenase YagT iron-sulfur-binding subunit